MRRQLDSRRAVATLAAAPAQPARESADTGSWSRLLSESARRFNFSPDAAFYVADQDGHILFSSPSYRYLVGVDSERAARIPTIVTEFVAGNRESYTQDESFGNNGSSGYWRSYHYPVFDEANALIGIIGHYAETTDQVEMQARSNRDLERLFDQVRASSDFFWEIDENGVLVDLSDRITSIVGKPALMFVGQELSSLGGFVTREGEACGPPIMFHTHQPFRDVIFRIVGEDGAQILFHLSGVPVFEHGSGEFKGFRGVGADVTERFRSEDAAVRARLELEKAQEALTNRNTQLEMERGRAEKALRAKSEFLATMSHELRTPLNAILGFSEAMSMKLFGDMNPQYANYANDIMKSGRHLLSLIDAMLDAASIEANELSLQPLSVDLHGLVRKAVSIVQIRAAAKELDLTGAEIAEGWIVRADPVPATQIFVNLLSNAVKFTPAGGQIGVDIGPRLDGPIPFAAITFWDTGIGVAKEMQDIIFDKFVRGTNASAYDDTGEGTGIGLHISRRLALLMEGNITLESAPGEGSRFTVLLPLVQAPSGVQTAVMV